MNISASKTLDGVVHYTTKVPLKTNRTAAVGVLIDSQGKQWSTVSENSGLHNSSPATRYELGSEPEKYAATVKVILSFISKLNVIRDVLNQKFDIKEPDLNPAISYTDFVRVNEGKFLERDGDFEEVFESVDFRCSATLIKDGISPSSSFGEIAMILVDKEV